jgi:hypothetical protein
VVAHAPDSDKFGWFGDILLEADVLLFIHSRRGGWVEGRGIGSEGCSELGRGWEWGNIPLILNRLNGPPHWTWR